MDTIQREAIPTWLVAIGGAVTGWAMGLPATYTMLMVFMVLDVITGLIAGWRSEEGLSSKIGWKGMRKKALTLCVVATAVILGRVAGLPAGEWAAGAFALVEVISVLENAQRGGVEIPEWMRVFSEKLLGAKRTSTTVTYPPDKAP